MKNIFKYSIFSLLFLSVMSCSDDDMTIATQSNAPELIAPASGTNIVLNDSYPDNPAVTFVWNHAAYSVATEINYQVEVAAVAGDGEYVAAGPSTSNRFLTLSVEELNTAAVSAGLEPFAAAELNVRVVATLGDANQMPMISNVVKINVTPYTAILPALYLVGAPQQHYGLNAWDNTTAMPMRYIGDGTTKVFEAYVKVGVDEGLKFIGEQGTWDNGNYGTIGNMQDGNLENSGGSGDVKPSLTDGPGLYYIWVDIDNLKYKAIKMDWGIIGDATPNGWNGETPMTYDFNSNKFSITTTLGAGELKFRSKNTGDYIYNGEWKFNVGNSDPKVAYDINAPNFAVSAGSHTIELSIDVQGEATVTGL